MWKGHPPSSSRHRRDRRDYAEAGYRRDHSRSISAAGSRGSATAHLQTSERLEPTQTGHDRLGLFNYLVGAGEDRRRDSQAERPRGFGVDDEFECGRLLNRKISRLSSLQDAVDIASGAAASSRHGELAAAAD